jgi:hypothetical protein
MNDIRPLPRVPKRRVAIILFLFAAAVAVVAWISIHLNGGILPILLFIAAGQVVHLYFKSRCPECRRGCVVRHDPIEDTKLSRVVFYCRHCQVGWDSGRVEVKKERT